jgi:hypothetical protein
MPICRRPRGKQSNSSNLVLGVLMDAIEDIQEVMVHNGSAGDKNQTVEMTV